MADAAAHVDSVMSARRRAFEPWVAWPDPAGGARACMAAGGEPPTAPRAAHDGTPAAPASSACISRALVVP